jgi:hypothetical protein
MQNPPVNPAAPRDYVAAKNRRDAMARLLADCPTLKALYRPGPSDDGKAGWINAIRDQHDPAYRLLFYLDRLPIAEEYRDRDLHELYFGEIDEHAEPNFQRVLFTTTGGVNLLWQDLPGANFAAALQTDSLEVVPVSMDRDLRVAHLLKDRFNYIAAFDEVRQGMWILNLEDFLEVYVSKEKCEIQVRDEERIIVGNTRILKPFFLRYVIKRTQHLSKDPSAAAEQILEDGDY